MSSPLKSPAEKLDEEKNEKSLKNQDRVLNKKNSDMLSKISENIRGLVRGFTSLFSGGSGGTSSSGSGYTAATGNDNESKVWNFFKSKGLNDYAIAGIMGNMKQESGFDPTASESGQGGRDGSGGYGLIQWTGGRRQKLFDAATAQGKDVNDIEFQLNYLWDEVFSSNSSYRSELEGKGFFNVNNVSDATHIYHDVVERSADTDADINKKRVQPAQDYYNKYSGTTSNTSGGSTASVAGSVANAVSSAASSVISNVGSSAIDKAVAWAVDIANDESHGYSQGNRWGPDYDCSSLVIQAYEQAGIPVKTKGASYTGNMEKVFKSLGFTDVTAETNHGLNIDKLQKGDVLLRPASHVEMYIGDGQKVGAHSSETGGIYGTAGDQTGHEIDVGKMSGSWDIILRAPGTYTPGTGASSGSSGGSFSGLGVFDSTYAITDAEKAQNQANAYWKQKLESGESLLQFKKGVDGPVVKVNDKKNMSGWDNRYSDELKSILDSTNKHSYDSSKNPNGSSIWESTQDANKDGSSIIYDPSGPTVPGNPTGGNGSGGGGSTANPDNPTGGGNDQDHMDYYNKLLEVLKLIEKNTSNIPITNDILNDILKLLDKGWTGDEGENNTLPNVNASQLFATLDPDISLIAAGI